MEQRLLWLPDVNTTAWAALGNAMRTGLPVPAGFIVLAATTEEQIRAAYEDLKIHERTHFLAVRGASHPILNVIGPDRLIHTLRRLWMESADSPLLVQRMIHATWCGKAEWQRKNLQINANEGMMVLDPDTYVVNSTTGRCIRRILQPKQRKMIRHVDGTAKIVQREGERTPMTADQLKSIADLAVRAATNIGWAIDDNDRLWLISV
jgi:phosphoenolpyruvate synthase/pyruvate phosphate dikinase